MFAFAVLCLGYTVSDSPHASYKVRYSYGKPFGMSVKDVEFYYGHYFHIPVM